MNYAEHLRALLRPLGVYRLSPDSLSGGEIEALGEAFDELMQTIDDGLREAIPVTAEADGLDRYRALIGFPSEALSTEQMRDAICGLLRLPFEAGSRSSVEDAAAFTGVSVQIEDGQTPGSLTVRLGYAGQPERWEEIREFLGRLLPAHASVQYLFIGGQ